MFFDGSPTHFIAAHVPSVHEKHENKMLDVLNVNTKDTERRQKSHSVAFVVNNLLTLCLLC